MRRPASISASATESRRAVSSTHESKRSAERNRTTTAVTAWPSAAEGKATPGPACRNDPNRASPVSGHSCHDFWAARTENLPSPCVPTHSGPVGGLDVSRPALICCPLSPTETLACQEPTKSQPALRIVINRWRKERQAHVDAVAAIDAMLDRWGIRFPSAGRRGRPRKAKRRAGRRKAAKRGSKRRGRPPGRKKKARGKRARPGAMSDAIVQFAKQAGAKGVTSAELTSFLKKRGAGQNPFVTIGRLVRTKRLKRQTVKGQRGSVYVAG